jgi:hypothetical protein
VVELVLDQSDVRWAVEAINEELADEGAADEGVVVEGQCGYGAVGQFYELVLFGVEVEDEVGVPEVVTADYEGFQVADVLHRQVRAVLKASDIQPVLRALDLVLYGLLFGDHDLLPFVPTNFVQPNMMSLEQSIHILLIELNPHNRKRMLQHRIENNPWTLFLRIMLI